MNNDTDITCIACYNAVFVISEYELCSCGNSHVSTNGTHW